MRERDRKREKNPCDSEFQVEWKAKEAIRSEKSSTCPPKPLSSSLLGWPSERIAFATLLDLAVFVRGSPLGKRVG